MDRAGHRANPEALRSMQRGAGSPWAAQGIARRFPRSVPPDLATPRESAPMLHPATSPVALRPTRRSNPEPCAVHGECGLEAILSVGEDARGEGVVGADWASEAPRAAPHQPQRLSPPAHGARSDTTPGVAALLCTRQQTIGLPDQDPGEIPSPAAVIFSLSRPRTSTWRIRSRVRFMISPTSSRVIPPRPATSSAQVSSISHTSR